MLITYCGDVHALWKRFKVCLDRHCPHNPVIQVGDLGIFGNKDEPTPEAYRKYKNFFFIHGNHSNPQACERYRPNYLGRFGFIKDWNLFFVSGAWSIDANMRIPFKSWWPDEELSMPECQQVVELYNKVKPKYIVTHDCPGPIARMVLGHQTQYKTRTGQLFDQLWQDYKPLVWIFGHYHCSFDKEVMGTRFICLNELEEKTLDLIP